MKAMRKRIEALEQRSATLPAAWIIRKMGETRDEAVARYEAKHGPIGDRFVFMWKPREPGDPKPCA